MPKTLKITLCPCDQKTKWERAGNVWEPLRSLIPFHFQQPRRLLELNKVNSQIHPTFWEWQSVDIPEFAPPLISESGTRFGRYRLDIWTFL